MKTLKINEKTHKELLQLTTYNGEKRTFDKVIGDLLEPTPIANLRKIKIDNLEGLILVADFFKDDIPINGVMKAEVCATFDSTKEIISIMNEFEKAKKISFVYFLGDDIYNLDCDDFYIDAHYGTSDTICFFLVVEDFMKYSKKIKKERISNE